jgi:amino acid transporter
MPDTALNIWTVSFFGEAEFWLALGKLILILGCLLCEPLVRTSGSPR